MHNFFQKMMLGGSTAALLAAMPTVQAFAQDNDIEQVVVSASRITIAGYSQPTPVTVVGAAQLQQDGFANIIDSLSTLPQVVAPPSGLSASQTGVTGGSVGANFVNLRGLGLTRTLVLFDGQRVVSSNLSLGGVDTTLFPTSLISRVDIVTGGASSAWGSDAVTGVVNFVLNKNYSGFKATIQAGDTWNGLSRNLYLDSAWGSDIFGGRGHVELSATANINPDTVLLTQEKYFRSTYWVSNPAYVAGNGQPQLILGYNVGNATSTPGGIINASPAGVAGPGVAPAAANALRGIEFVGGGTPQLVNYGNVTLGSISNGGSLTVADTQSPENTISSPHSSYTFFGYGRYKLTSTIQAAVQLNYGYSIAAGDTVGALQTALAIKSDNAYIPASVRSTMQNGGITSFTLGTLNSGNFNAYGNTSANFASQIQGAFSPIFSTDHRNFIRGVFSLDGTLGDNWSWNAYIQHSAVRLAVYSTNAAITANLAAAQDAVTVTSANVGKTGLPLGSIACRTTLTGVAVVSGSVTAQSGCIPLDVFGTGVASPASIAYITGATAGLSDVGHESLSQEVAEGSMQGTLPWALPAGKIAVAFGMGYRKEGAFENLYAIGAAGGYINVNFAVYPPVSYNVLEGFAEVDAPILKNTIVNSLDVSMAGRMTSYSTSGLVETWKLGATSQINDDIKLRTTWSVDIRAPALNELFSIGTFSVNTARDPKTQATVLSTQFTTGNPNLVPEVAHTVSGGVVLTPTFIPGLSMSADWYSINLTGEIAALSSSVFLGECNATLPSVIHPGQNGNPNDPLCSHLQFNGPGGALSGILLSPVNIASQTKSGLDLQANYTMDFWDGTLAWATTDNLEDEFTTRNPGMATNDTPGLNATQGKVTEGPKWKGVLSATYATGPYSVTAQGRWYGTYRYSNLGNTGNLATPATANLYDPAHYEVPFVATLDLRANYKWNDNISFFGAVDNTLNTPPPLNPNTSSNVSTAYYNTNPTYGNTLGRSYRLGVRLNY